MHRFAVLPCLLVLACSGGEPVKTAAAAPPGSSTERNVSQNTEKSGGDAPSKMNAKTSVISATPNAASVPRSGGVPGPVDPPWFRLELFAGSTLTSSGRTPRDDQGLFATQMLFTLADGTTRDACLDTLRKALADAVPTMTQEEGADGRATLHGSNADYQVTLICGTAKGKPTAYVSYRWRKPPPQ